MITHTISWKKVVIISLLVLVLAPQIFGSYVEAQTSTVNFAAAARSTSASLSCENTSWSQWLPCAILMPIAWFAGLFVSLGAALITYGLEINAGLAYKDTVQGGFEITLMVANLGFVLAIIVIAIATIIGYESYGMKKNLWKLIVSALLVNFSLVICSTIISFFDQFAYFFADRMGSSDTAGYGYSQVALQLVDAFALNKIAAASPAASAVKGAVAFIPTVMFIVLALFLIGITLLSVALSLVVRYVYLMILMILMPIAWLAWVVPEFQKHWSNWWEKFIQWVMSPTIMLMFLYIAVQIMAGSTPTFEEAARNSSGAGSAGGVFDEATGGSGLLGTFMKMIIGLALVWGGIIVANAAGAKGAATIVGWGNKAGKAAKNRATIYGKRARSYPLRTPVGRSATEKLQTVGNQSNVFLRTISAPVRGIGTALSNARMTGEKTLHDSEKDYKDLTLDEQIRRFGWADSAGRLFILTNINKAIKTSGDALRKAESASDKDEPQGRARIATARKEHHKNQALLATLPQTIREDLEEYNNSKSQIEGHEQLVLQTKLDLDQARRAGDKARMASATEALKSAQATLGDLRTRTKYGKLFVLYGQHEHKHKKSLEDELKERFSKKDDDHEDDHGAGAQPATATPGAGGANAH